MPETAQHHPPAAQHHGPQQHGSAPHHGAGKGHKGHEGGKKGHHGEHGGHEEEEEFTPAMDTSQEGAGTSHEFGGHDKGGEGGGEGGHGKGGEGKDGEGSKSPVGFSMTFSKEGFSMAGSYKIADAAFPPVYIPPTPIYVTGSAGLSVSGGFGVPWTKPNFAVAVGLGGDIGIELGCGEPHLAAIYGKAVVGVSAPLVFTKTPESWNLRGSIEAESHFRVGVKFAGGIIDYGFNFGKLDIFKLGFVKEKGKPFAWHGFEWGPELVKLGNWLKSAGQRIKGMFTRAGQKIKGWFKKLKAKLFGSKDKKEKAENGNVAPPVEAAAGPEGGHVEVASVEQAETELAEAEKHGRQEEASHW